LPIKAFEILYSLLFQVPAHEPTSMYLFATEAEGLLDLGNLFLFFSPRLCVDSKAEEDKMRGVASRFVEV
jgi:hypothetical protein